MKRLLSYFIVAIIFLGIGVSATILYKAEDISYTNENTDATNVQSAMDELYKESLTLNADLLWTNPNSYSAGYSGGTISLDLSNYTYIVFETYHNYSTEGDHAMTILPVGTENKKIFTSSTGDKNVNWRTVTITTKGITISENGTWTNGTGPNLCIPYKIYGIKKLVIE